jgi:hypothetical protein
MSSFRKLHRINSRKLQRRIESRKKRFFRWLQLNRKIIGLPKGLEFDTLDRICKENFCTTVKRISYVHMSGWKQSGAFRLYIRCESGQTYKLIYKDATYSEDEIPALDGLSVLPGPPEYHIYKSPSSALMQLLPKVYLCQELIPGRRYRYVLEDLFQNHTLLREFKGGSNKKWENLLLAVKQLPHIHKVLDDWYSGEMVDGLLKYDQSFTDELLIYAKTNLEKYWEETGETIANRILQSWNDINDLRKQLKVRGNELQFPIHGDIHPGHIFVDRNDAGSFKLIDWEWVGLGKKHADLASLLKRVTENFENTALEQYAQLDPDLSLDEHRWNYEWCQIERGLLDAAYLAKQQLDMRTISNWVPNYIRLSIRRTLRAIEELQN